jgi:small nuclear ribonucleoprotein (snRNP)-like protein
VKFFDEIATSTHANNHRKCVHPHSTTRANSVVFYSFFKTLVDQEVTVELKNDLTIKGILKSVDQFLNIKLDDITVLEENKYPHLVPPPHQPS